MISIAGAILVSNTGSLLLQRRDNNPAIFSPNILEGVQKEQFLILPHPEVEQFMQNKTADYDRWLGGMRKLRANIIDAVGSTKLKDMHKLF